MYIVLSVLAGVIIGCLLPYSIPAEYSIYAAVMLLAQPLEELKGFWEEAASWGQLPVQLFVPLVKTVGIALLCRTGSDLCRDAGESAIGSVLETAGAVAAIVVSLPLFRSAWELLRSLV